MKIRYLLLVFLLFAVTQVSAGSIFYIGGGMNLSLPIANKVMNGTFDEYNRSRSYLSRPMPHLTWMYGGQAMMGGMFGKGWTGEMCWAGAHQKLYAEGVDNSGTLKRREVKIRNNMFSFAGGYTFRPGKVFRPGFLLGMDFGNFREFTRAGEASSIGDVKYADVHKSLELGFTVMANFMFFTKKYVAFAIRPYYQAQVFKEDLMYLMDAINPNSQYPDAVSETNSHFGVQVAIMLYFGHNDRY